MGIHNPNAIAQMVINLGPADYHLSAPEPCPHDPANRYRMVVTLRGRLCEQHRQRRKIHAVRARLDNLNVPPSSLRIDDTGRSALITLSGDEMTIIMARFLLS